MKFHVVVEQHWQKHDARANLFFCFSPFLLPSSLLKLPIKFTFWTRKFIFEKQLSDIPNCWCYDCSICWPFQLRHGSSPYLDTMSVMKLPLENYSGKWKFWISIMESCHNRLNETDSWIMSRTHKELLKAMSKFTYQSIIEDKEADISSMMHFISSHDRAGMITHPDPSKLHVCYFTVFIRSL